MSDKQARQYQLTINNPLPEYTHSKIKEIATLKFKTFEFLAMSDEVGEQGTLHTHIYMSFRSAVRFSTVKKNFPRAHIESVRGSVKDNIDYIKKQGKWAETSKSETSIEGSYEELGDRPTENKGKNPMYAELYKMVVEEELSNAEIIRINNDYLTMIDTITRLRTMFLQEKYKGTRRLELETIFVQGITGAGKSRTILDEYGDENCYRVTDYSHPFDSYQTEEVLVFEEFRSNIPISDMLNYLDIYPLVLPARYAQKQACYTKVFITTNLPLEEQYKEIQRINRESWDAFLRRIHKVRVYYAKGAYKEYNSVKEYFERDKNFRPLRDDENPFVKG